MPRGNLSVIGLDTVELEWIRLLLKMLRHTDPVVNELMRQALVYVDKVSRGRGQACG
jgi:hypothetical protein